ncbi:MAG: SDR family NAD(P)-dependent oxidoreductase [Lachnospiraceae bacterium]|nr:SDR family NAD(P)-dependent oxidoreductase [Lachnospiraceae bacterium]
MLLENKTAVVTGCLQGIGRAVLDLFVREGADVFACCQKETEEFKEHVDALSKEYGREVIPVYFDLKDADAIRDAARTIQKSRKKIDMLINVAGIADDAYFQMMSMESLKNTFEVNFFSQMLLTQYMVKLMLRNKKGSIVYVSSVIGLDGNAGQLAYSASKAAMAAATKTLSAELAEKGIRVNAVAPGVIDTAMTSVLSEEILDRQLRNADIPRKGTPQEVADVILYLASDRASYVTGQILRVDAGIG